MRLLFDAWLELPANGHPEDKWGFVIGAGIKLNAPMIGQGDFFQAQVNYTQGALRYIFQTPNSNWGKSDGASEGFGVVSDAVYNGAIAAANATDLELTTAWNVNAAYEHFWNPRWRTSLYGGYAAVSYSDRGNALICSGEGGGSEGYGGCCFRGLRQQLEHVVARFTHPMECHQGLLLGSGRDVLQADSASLPGNILTEEPCLSAARQTSPTSTTGNSASASIAISIPDELWFEGNGPRRETAGGFCFHIRSSLHSPAHPRASGGSSPSSQKADAFACAGMSGGNSGHGERGPEIVHTRLLTLILYDDIPIAFCSLEGVI